MNRSLIRLSLVTLGLVALAGLVVAQPGEEPVPPELFDLFGSVVASIIEFFVTLVGVAIVGAVLVAVFDGGVRTFIDSVYRKPFHAVGIGAGITIALTIALVFVSILLIITIVGILLLIPLLIGIWLLTFPFMALGALFVGDWIYKEFLAEPSREPKRLWYALGVGVPIVAILSAIPFVGFFGQFAVLSVVFGGLVVQLLDL